MTDTNISYIWGFLKKCHERGWLYKGHRPMPWCPRCGTSLSQHELHRFLQRRSRTRRCTCASRCVGARRTRSWWCGRRRPGRCPRTSPRRSSPTRTTRGCETGGRDRLRGARARLGHVPLKGKVVGTRQGRRAGRAGRTRGPFDDLAAQEGVEHRDRRLGRGRRWTRARASSTSRRAAAPRTSSWAAAGARRCSCRSTRPGAFYDGFGWLHGRHTADAAPADRRGPRAARPAGRRRRAHPPLSRLLALRHRADLPARRRVVHPLRRAAPADDRRRPRRSSGRRRTTASGWRTGCATWATGASRRKRYWGLPLPFYFCPDGHMTVDRLARRSCASARLRGLDAARRSCTARGSTRSRSAAPSAAPRPTRVPEVGDCWLDAGHRPVLDARLAQRHVRRARATPPAPARA